MTQCYKLTLQLEYVSDDGNLNYHRALAPTVSELCEIMALDTSQVMDYSKRLIEMDDGRIDD